ncbi:MAG: hypothetical protein CO096_24460, partial [Armatimonadetes bacterium CG_4_9_14_3_um_filter_66_14]
MKIDVYVVHWVGICPRSRLANTGPVTGVPPSAPRLRPRKHSRYTVDGWNAISSDRQKLLSSPVPVAASARCPAGASPRSHWPLPPDSRHPAGFASPCSNDGFGTSTVWAKLSWAVSATATAICERRFICEFTPSKTTYSRARYSPREQVPLPVAPGGQLTARPRRVPSMTCLPMLLAVALNGGTAVTAELTDQPPLYHPPGMWCWDFWFAKQSDAYHAFYLEAPFCLGDPQRMHGNQHVGHATSPDLIHWTNQGPAAVPILGTWNDLSIATGSVVAHGGKWWMLYTGRGSKVSGLGLAVSDDLMAWRKVGDGPVVLLGKPFPGEWEGKPLQWVGLADPYLYPEPVDGWYYLVLNSQ